MQVPNSTGERGLTQITLGSDYKVEILIYTAVSRVIPWSRVAHMAYRVSFMSAGNR